ncbi:MAG: redoxin domain-containing protein [bacterium]|nr:redoxin domain-containing protein [bacterium]
MEALQDRFLAANTQVLGVSVDSLYCHGNWAYGLGGVSFPLLADFHPKGGVAKSYGLYLEEPGITDRATVIIDADGIVRHISSVGPGGKRDISELAALCEEVDGAYEGSLGAMSEAPGLEAGTKLYVRSNCMFSTNTLAALENLKLTDKVPVVNVSEDSAALDELVGIAGKGQAPCLVVGGAPRHESGDIITYLANRVSEL